MESKDYKRILLNDFDEKELSKEGFENTLMHFAQLYLEENLEKIFKK